MKWLETLNSEICALSPRVIALGESVHGSANLHALIVETLLDLIRSKKITNIGFEMPMSTMNELNNYCLGQTESSIETVFNRVYMVFRSIEFFGFFRKLKTLNELLPENQKISLFGFDIRDPWLTAPKMLRQPDFRKKLERIEILFLETLTQEKFYRLEHAAFSRVITTEDRAIVTSIVSKLEDFDSIDEGYLLVKNALESCLKYIGSTDGSFFQTAQIRDRAMFQQARAQLKYQSSATALVGHLFHVAKATEDRQIAGADYRLPKSMGQHLAEYLGAKYLVCGFSFRSGSYRRSPEQTPIVIAHSDSVESKLIEGTILSKNSGLAAMNIAHFKITEGIEIDDSRVPMGGLLADFVDAFVTVDKSSATIIKSECS